MPLTLPIAPLSAVQEPALDIDDCTDAYGALPFDMDELEQGMCDKSPSGQHEYCAFDDHTCCIHCGEDSTL
jgi:hypothetical protein